MRSRVRLTVLSLAIALTAVIAISALVATRFRTVLIDQELQVRQSERDRLLAEQLVANSERASRDLRAYLLTGDERLLASRDAATNAFHAALSELTSRSQDRATRRLLDEIDSTSAALNESAYLAIDQRRSALRPGDPLAIFERRIQPAADRLQVLMGAVADVKEAVGVQARGAASDAVRLAFLWLAVAIVSALLLAATLAFFLIRVLSILDEERAGLERRVSERTDALAVANEKLRVLASRDSLTGVWNRAAMEERLAEECARAGRYGQPLALLVMDVDHFKQINDTIGHVAGDAVLKEVAAKASTLRASDFLARFGGEEFVAILPNTDPEGARQVAERMRTTIEAGPWDRKAVTVSIGVSNWGRAQTAEQILEAADDALYRSKRGGRNRVTTAEPSNHREA